MSTIFVIVCVSVYICVCVLYVCVCVCDLLVRVCQCVCVCEHACVGLKCVLHVLHKGVCGVEEHMVQVFTHLA